LQRHDLAYSLNKFYRVIGRSKQAVHQAYIRQQKMEEQLNELILLMDILRSEHPGCGLEKAYDTLNPTFIGRDRFIDKFIEFGYRVKLKKRTVKTTWPGSYKYKNLIEGMIVNRINQILQSDITYILVNEIFYYAVFIIDVYSKRIVAHQVSTHMRAQANMDSLKQVVKLRGRSSMVGCIHHSDRGTQYGSLAYRKLLDKLKCFLSMGIGAEKNAYAERVNGIIKNEYLQYWKIDSFKDLEVSVEKAVKHYNQKRIHRHLPSKLSPISFEEKWKNSTELQKHREMIHQPNNFVIRSKQKIFFNQIETANGNFCPLSIQ